MNITGIGSSFAYIYNFKTGKLSTKDGTADEFVDYFNGDLAGEESESLNGFDACKKADIETMIEMLNDGALRLDNPGKEEYEISGEIVDAVKAEYSVDGRNIFAAYKGVTYTADEIKSFSTQNGPYKTRQSRGYDPTDNSIHIAVGDVFNLGNGYRLRVGIDCVYGEGYGSGSEEDDQKMRQLVRALDSLIRFADQQCFSSWIDAESTPMLLEFLRELGVDTSREFRINETKCEVAYGRISEVGNNFVVPSSIFNKAVKRYEEMLYQPLSERE